MARYVWSILSVILVGFLSACGSGGSQSMPPEEDLILAFTPVATNIDRPTAIVHAGDGSGRLFLVEQAGTIRILRNGSVLGPAFLDISNAVLSGGEQGLLGLAFPPGFSQKGYFYVNYTRALGSSLGSETVISRFFVSLDNPDLALAASEEIILTQEQPFANHNGGQLAFGPDGFLYVGLGDGGSGGDPQGHGQNPATLLGTLLRIDVESESVPYTIPPDNPFVNHPTARQEIWATGLRNPWRFSFDRDNGDLYVADVGQERWEEVNFQAAGTVGGANYGWNFLEGPDCFRPAVGCIEPVG